MTDQSRTPKTPVKFALLIGTALLVTFALAFGTAAGVVSSSKQAGAANAPSSTKKCGTMHDVPRYDPDRPDNDSAKYRVIKNIRKQKYGRPGWRFSCRQARKVMRKHAGTKGQSFRLLGRRWQCFSTVVDARQFGTVLVVAFDCAAGDIAGDDFWRVQAKGITD